MKTLFAAAAAAAALASAGAASAQPRGPAITLYDLPNYQGPSRTYFAGVDNLADLGLNDRAQSLRMQGRWRVCNDARLRGRCVEVSGDVPNLAAYGMTAAISSFESLDRDRNTGRDDRYPDRGYDRPTPPPPPPPPPGPPPGDRNFSGPSLEGGHAAFFPRPQPGPYRGATEFCRRLGFKGALYADDRGGYEIRDVLCERWQ